MKVHIELFGTLREAGTGDAIELELPARASVAMLRNTLAEHLAEHAPALPHGLLQHCAFASEDAILQDSDAVPHDRRLAVLPPVSGG